MRGVSGLPKYDDVEFDRERWPDFQPHELGCRNGNFPNRVKCRFCGGDYFHAPDFLDRLQRLRTRLGHPVVINSAHRCRKSELAVGGVMGQHRHIAADVLILGNDRHLIVSNAREIGFRGIGKYRFFIHLDMRAGRKAEWFGRGAERFWNV